MLILRCTKKLRDRLKGAPVAAAETSTTVLGDWFATAMFWKPHVVLLVNRHTYLPVLLPLAPTSTLLQRIPDAIATALSAHAIDQLIIVAEVDAMREVRVAPTNNRSVVGVMNEFAFLAERFYSGGDLGALGVRLSDTPTGPLYKSMSFPNKELNAYLESESTMTASPAPSTRQLPASQSAAEQTALQLKVTLAGSKPPIWRRILVDGSSTLGELHEVIQAAFGWWNCHLHEFEIGSTRYGIPDPDFDFGTPTIDEATVALNAVISVGSRFSYTYDFGDDWTHKIVVEKDVSIAAGDPLPACIGGRRACPPEDCGGLWGYEELTANSGRNDGIDPNAFDNNDFETNLVAVRELKFDT